MNRAQGFTLIELIIVVAIIAILAAIASIAYGDYVARAQVAEGVSLATGAKTAIALYYADTGGFPNDNQQAGMAEPGSIIGKYVESVTVNNTGTIEVLFGHDANYNISGQSMTMIANDNDGSLSWHCGGVKDKYLPSACRN
ncbi:pilin [Lysobacter sp. F6437]|uniref:pilin n=1 Tax=Lysobacter sp. F6437 TaxID=3459296 RepID=UPI00403E033D